MMPSEIIRAGAVQRARPWPRHVISSANWRDMARTLPTQPELRFEALWADADRVYALFTRTEPLLVCTPVEAGLYAALSPFRPEAALFERAIHDLWGHLAADAADGRPTLDHGVWPMLHPMAARPVPNTGAPESIDLKPAPDGSIQLRSGPIAAPGPALRAVAAGGERITQLDTRLGYAHRGALQLIRGQTLAEAAPLAARLSGEGTVAHSLAFARAVEAATASEPPPRALAIRNVLGDIERIAIGLHDIAAALEAASLAAAALRQSREDLLRACQLAFGHRLLMDLVIPGGLARDIAPDGAAALAAPVEALRLPTISRHPRLKPLAQRLATLRDAQHSLLTRPRTLPEGALVSAIPVTDGEGLGRADGPRGTHWHWLQIRGGRIAEVFARDPATILWQSLGPAAYGAALSDLPIIEAALGLSVAGADL